RPRPRTVRRDAGVPQSSRPYVRTYRRRLARTVGQLSADLCPGGRDQHGDAPQPVVERDAVNRVVIISNRVPPVRERKIAPGGLVTALVSAFRARHGLWFGWSGEVKETQTTDVVTRERHEYTLATIDLS